MAAAMLESIVAIPLAIVPSPTTPLPASAEIILEMALPVLIAISARAKALLAMAKLRS